MRGSEGPKGPVVNEQLALDSGIYIDSVSYHLCSPVVLLESVP